MAAMYDRMRRMVCFMCAKINSRNDICKYFTGVLLFRIGGQLLVSMPSCGFFHF